MMLTISEIRYANLEYLIRRAGGLTQLVDQSGGRLSRATLYQILERKTTQAGTPKSVGDELARSVERTLKLERGWMDYAHSERGEPDIDRDDLISRLRTHLDELSDEQLKAMAVLLNLPV